MVLLIIVMTLFLAILILNQTYGFKIVTVGDLDCSHRSLQTMKSILSYLRQNKTDRFIFLGDIDYRNKTFLRISYAICGQYFLEQIPKYTELMMIRGNHENNRLWKNIRNHFALPDNI